MSITKIVYLNSVSLDDRCFETLAQLQALNYRGVDLKKLGGYQIWSIRTSDAGRLLLSRIHFQGELSWLVLEYLPTHGYDSARFLKPNVLLRFLEVNQSVLEAINEDHFQKVEQSDDDDNDKATSSMHRVHYYNREYISLSHAQQDILRQPLPLVLSGMPGSGKTCIGFVLLENYISQNKGTAFRILYITLSDTLASNMKKIWFETNADLTSAVAFVSISEFIRQDPNVANLKPVKSLEFQAWYQLQNQTWDVKNVYEEFKCIAVTAHVNEYIEQSGTRNSLFHDLNVKKDLFDLYQRYAAYLKANGLIDLFFYQANIQQKYDFIFVDEAQNLSHTQLRYLLQAANQQQICYAMDTNQNMQKGVSTRPYLLQLIAQNSHKTVGHFNLLQTFRNPPIVVDLANAVLQIKNALVGGVADANEYTQAIAQPNSQSNGQVKWFDNADKELIDLADNANCAIVVNSEEDKKRAFELFSSPLIFTREEIQGLQFDIIILFEPLEDPALVSVNKAIPDDLQNRILKQHRPKNKDDQTALAYVQSLNALYTSITRSCESVYFLSKQTHQNAKIQTHLKQATARYATNSTVKIASKPTDDQWEARAKDLEEYNKTEQAEAIYRLKLKRTRSQKKNSISTSASSTNSATTPVVIVDDFIRTPTASKLKELLQSENSTRLLYATKGSAGLTIIESIKKNFHFYVPTFLQVNEASKMSAVLLRDPLVQAQLNIPRKNFFSENVFGKYCYSEIGTQILITVLYATPGICNDLMNSVKNKISFWTHAAKMLQTDPGQQLFDELTQLDVHSGALTKKILFTNELFQMLCLDPKRGRTLLKIITANPTWLTDFDPATLLKPFYHSYNAFSLLTSYLIGVQVLQLIGKANPRFYRHLTPEYLFAKNLYWAEITTGKTFLYTPPYNIKSFDEQHVRKVVLSPFHQLTVGGFDIAMNFLFDLLQFPALLNALSLSELCNRESVIKPKLDYSPFNFLVSVVGGPKILSYLVKKRPEMIRDLPLQEIFSHPVYDPDSTITVPPALYHMMIIEENQSALYFLLSMRKDINAQFMSYLQGDGAKALSTLVVTEMGRQIIKSLLAVSNQEMQKINWSLFGAACNDYILLSKRITPFHLLIQLDPNLLFLLFENIPDLVKHITIFNLFDLNLKNPLTTGANAVYFSAFMWLCTCKRGQEVLTKLMKLLPDFVESVDHFQLYNEQQLLQRAQPAASAFENLCMNELGISILNKLLHDQPQLLNALPDLMLPKMVRTVVSELEEAFYPLVFYMAHNEPGCALILYLILQKPKLINEQLARAIFYEISNSHLAETICTYALMLVHRSGAEVLTHIQKTRPDLGAFFFRNTQRLVESSSTSTSTHIHQPRAN